MFQLRLLGATDLRDAHGVPVNDLLAQPSRSAVLAYLAVRGDVMVRRDELLPVFWPELDEARARNALSQALHVIRRALVPEAVITRGADLGIDTRIIQCDVVMLERCALAGDDEGVVAAYGGNLLPAFTLSGAPAFNRWLDAERSRLRAIAAAAAMRASEHARARGDLQAAIKYGRVLLDIDANERALRMLMELHEHAGDRAAALATHQEFSRLPRVDQPRELSAETQALVTRLSDAPPPLPAHQSRRRLRIALGIGAAATIIAAAWIAAARARAPRVAAPAIRIAVMPFRIFATPDLAYLSGGMMDVLSIDMDGVGPIRTIDPHAVASFVAHRDTADQLALGAAAARALSADRFVLGTVVVTGKHARVSASLYDAGGNVMTTGTADVDEPTTVVLATDRIARELLAHELPSPAQGLSRLAALTSTSTVALRHYLDGEHYYREGRFDRAAESFGAAVREDSSFALGNYRMAASLDWGIHIWQGESQYDFLARALRHMERLGARDQQVIRALYEFWLGSPARAAQLYRNVLADRPDDVEAWEELAEVTFHRLVFLGTPIGSARTPFERVLALDAGNVNAMVHLSRLAALRGDDLACAALSRRALTLAPTHNARFELRLLAALATHDDETRAHALEALAGVPAADEQYEDPTWLAGWRVAIFREDPPTGLAIARTLTDSRRPPASRLLGEIMAAEMSAGMGRWDDVSRHVDAASRIDATFARQVRASLTLLGPFEPTPARLAQLRASTLMTAVLAPLPTVIRADSTPPWFERGLEALVSRDSAVRIAAEHALEAPHSNPENDALFTFQSNILKARALQQAGANHQALALLERSWLATGVTSAPQYARGSERLLRADLLHAVGRDREAITWYQSIPEDLGMGIVYAAPAHLGAARAYDALGDRAAAAREYGRVAALWREATGELKAIAEDARHHVESARQDH